MSFKKTDFDLSHVEQEMLESFAQGEHEEAVREAFTLLAENEAEELKADAEKTEEGRGRRRL